MMKNIILLLFLTVMGTSFAAEDIAYPGFLKKLQKLGINDTVFDNESSKNLRGYLENQIESIELKLDKASKKEKDKLKEFKLYYKFAKKYHKKALEFKDPSDAFRFYVTALRIIYAIESNTQDPVEHFELNDIPNLIHRLDTNIPFVGKDFRLNPIGSKQAKKEASFLVDPVTNKYVSEDELSRMNHVEISKLDVADHHPVWKTEKARLKIKDHYKEIEKWAQKRQQKELIKKVKKKLNIESLSGAGLEEYSLHKARKVLFFDKIKESATSPKINTKDAYDEKWKLKWGNEVQTEPFVNRLAMKLGARFTDLVYANEPGVDGVVLILNGKEQSGDCDYINTVELFKSCLLKSKYEFLVDPYIFNTGIITKDNKDMILKNLSHSGFEKYARENLLGREYITFKESMVEFKSDRIMTRTGAAAGSFLGARQDRIGRAYLMIAAYLYNIDQKDFNNKTVIAENFEGKDDVYLEYAHDLGASLGQPGQSLHINGLSYGRGFLKQPLFYGNDIIVDQLMIYRPKAWLDITFADAMWMTRKILSIKKSDLDEMASHTLWPKYMQKALVQMMRLRRNRMAEVFLMQDELAVDERVIKPLTIVRDLSTAQKREAVAQEFKLDQKLIESIMDKNGLLDKNGNSQYIDYLVKKNKVISCRDSIITNLLEKIHFPSGLERRQKRSKDNKPLSNCRFRKKNKSS